MSNVDDPSKIAADSSADAKLGSAPAENYKGKAKLPQEDAMEEDIDDDDDDEEGEEEGDEDGMEEEEDDENAEMDDEGDEQIDPQAILPPGRRTRGVKIDYASQEAHEKAGLAKTDDDDDEDEFKA